MDNSWVGDRVIRIMCNGIEELREKCQMRCGMSELPIIVPIHLSVKTHTKN
jgi:hypothetical protein